MQATNLLVPAIAIAVLACTMLLRGPCAISLRRAVLSMFNQLGRQDDELGHTTTCAGKDEAFKLTVVIYTSSRLRLLALASLTQLPFPSPPPPPPLSVASGSIVHSRHVFL